MSQRKKRSKNLMKETTLELIIYCTICWLIKMVFMLSLMIVRITYHLLRDLILRTIPLIKNAAVSFKTQDFSKMAYAIKKLNLHSKRMKQEKQVIEQPLIIEVYPTKYEYLKIVK